MSKSTKAFIYNLICFAVLFLIFYQIIGMYTGLKGFFIPITSFVIVTILSPKFQAVKTHEGEKLFMAWIFIKGVREIK